MKYLLKVLLQGRINDATTTEKLFRKEINGNSGDAFDIPFPNVVIASSSFQEENGNVFLIPHTNLFAYLYNGSIIGGEPSWLPKSGFGTEVQKIYENQQIVMSYYKNAKC